MYYNNAAGEKLKWSNTTEHRPVIAFALRQQIPVLNVSLHNLFLILNICICEDSWAVLRNAVPATLGTFYFMAKKANKSAILIFGNSMFEIILF